MVKLSKKIILLLLVVAVAMSSVVMFAGCDNGILVEVDYQIVTQYSESDSVSPGELLTRPSDPTFVDGVFTSGIGGLTAKGYSRDGSFEMEHPLMGAGFDVNRNYLFIGWYKEPECIRPWTFGEDRIYQHTIIYAKWIEVA